MDSINTIPRHVSIIMDGNGRWAKARGLDRVQGHIQGVESVRACLEESVRLGIEYLSVYAFSEENWNRPVEEVSFLMELMFNSMIKELRTFLENNVRFKVLGNRERLGEKLNKTIDELEQVTSESYKTTLIIFMSYSGKWDLLQAFKKMAADMTPDQIENAGLDDVDRYLVTAGIPDPDLLIRTSGEIRISNYLLWQSAYTEFYFTDVLWPDFGKKEFCVALDDYARRDRRYGKVK